MVARWFATLFVYGFEIPAFYNLATINTPVSLYCTSERATRNPNDMFQTCNYDRQTAYMNDTVRPSRPSGSWITCYIIYPIDPISYRS